MTIPTPSLWISNCLIGYIRLHIVCCFISICIWFSSFILSVWWTPNFLHVCMFFFILDPSIFRCPFDLSNLHPMSLNYVIYIYIYIYMTFPSHSNAISPFFSPSEVFGLQHGRASGRRAADRLLRRRQARAAGGRTDDRRQAEMAAEMWHLWHGHARLTSLEDNHWIGLMLDMMDMIDQWWIMMNYDELWLDVWWFFTCGTIDCMCSRSRPGRSVARLHWWWRNPFPVSGFVFLFFCFC